MNHKMNHHNLSMRWLGYVIAGILLPAVCSLAAIGLEIPRLFLEAFFFWGFIGGVVGALVGWVDRHFAGSTAASVLGVLCGAAGGIIISASLYLARTPASIVSTETATILSNGTLWGIFIGMVLGAVAMHARS